MRDLIADDNLEFAAYCILRSEVGGNETYSESTMTSILTDLGVPYRPPVEGGSSRSVTRGPLQVGEIVKVLGEKCTHELNSNLCRSRKISFSPENPKYFVVKSITHPREEDGGYPVIKISEIGDDGRQSSTSYDFYAVPQTKGTKGLVTKINKQIEYMESGSKRYNEGTLKKLREDLSSKSLEPHDGHGLYRAGWRTLKGFADYLESFKSQEQFEIVYKRGLDNEVPEYRSEFTEHFSDWNDLSQAIRDEDLDVEQLLDPQTLRRYGKMYYRAPISFFGDSKKGEKFAQIDTRLQRGSASTINPNVGKIFYIGKVGQRPSGWREALKDILSEQSENIL